MENNLCIEYHVDSRHIFMTYTYDEEIGAIDEEVIKVPDGLDVAQEALGLYEIYCEDLSLENWEIELIPLEDLGVEVVA